MNEQTQRERDRTTGGYPPREALADAWDEHSRYVGFAAGLFAFGIIVGIALMAAGYNLLEIIEELVGEPLFPDIGGQSRTELMRFLLVNNTRAFLLSILGALTLGLLTAWAMVFNGVIVGNVGAFVASDVGIGFILVGLLPHGIFELPALFIAAGVGFRLLYRVGQRLRGLRDAILTRRYLYRTGLLVLAGWLLLVVAAVVEAFVTPALLEALFAA
ncbi:stage II sporulation protein M [Natrinema sp. DC36]|uniref:stage II sporulation protein M n=1 Tax=Natrinema sp. DC36 TaxID=2878680 RepID=UPI001CF08B7D|nr:stage II sporulation protein M [Natrinema sp. DC36]